MHLRWESATEEPIANVTLTLKFLILQILMNEMKNSIFVKIRFEYPSRFRLQLQGEGSYQTKLDIKTFFFSRSNREAQRCNGQKSRLSKLLSLVQKQLQKYNIRDSISVSYVLQQLIEINHSRKGQ